MIKPIQIALAPTRNRPLNMFLGVVLALLSLLLFLAIATYHVTDPSLNTSIDPGSVPAVANWVGPFGAYLSDLFLQVLGISAFFVPVLTGLVAWGWMRSRYAGVAWLRALGTAFSLTFLPAVFGLVPWHWRWLHAVPVEGVVGRVVSDVLVAYLNVPGAWIVSSVLALAGIYFALAVNLRMLWESLEDRWILLQSWHDRWSNWRDARADRRAEREIPEPGPEQRIFSGALGAEVAEPVARVQPPSRLAALFGRRGKKIEVDPVDEIPAFQRAAQQAAEPQIPVTQPARRASIWERDQQSAAAPVNAAPVAPTPAPPIPVTPIAPRAEAMPAASAAPPALLRPIADPWAEMPPAKPAPAPPRPEPVRAPQPVQQQLPPQPPPQASGEIAIHERADADMRHVTVAPKNVSGFKLPPSTLLHSGGGPQAVREEALREEAKVLVEKCSEFDVRGQVVQINPGPMVTTYEFKPEAGVKYSRVTGLADDLCLAMRAESILIERMAGKSTVGIQVPNHERETIHLRDVIESEPFAKAKSRLTLAMGKDINGRIVTADLASMPHVLIAGSTGSGKSVAINAMIMSLLFRTTPAQVRLILVDPKRVELGMYEGVPHLFTPIITEPKLAANALRNAVREMERRLKLLASRSVRNIDQYNKLFEGVMPSLFDDGQQEEPLPYIVIIIDELADLMMLDRANVEESITRLAQMARAVGIHLVLATQRPSVDVITGLIKANVPTRISFRLATKVDSRTIIDTNGAEALLGRGDMLFLPPGTSRLMRLHAPYVSEKETAAIVTFWKDQGQAEYVEGFLESPKDERAAIEGSGGEEDENDPMFDDAVRLVFEFGKASTSLLQRRLRIGYGRAAHLIDLMERDGLVGPADGSRPRELLKAPGWLHEIAANE
ncbi:DNA translocase FtsK [Acidobacteria bacterium AB60]|nr:DNA translocase FtsK [Acidobacteria bacterium AB60]